jgi:large subunit ribosomal protein L16
MVKKIPSRTKYLKSYAKSSLNSRSKLSNLRFGVFGMQSLECKFISSNSLESARIAINHCLKRKGKLWCRIFPQVPITRKAAETRMGKGKGDVSYYAAQVRSGTVIFEVSGVSMLLAKQAFSLGDRKLPVKCRFICYLYSNII